MEGTMKRVTMEELRLDPMAMCDMLNSLFMGLDVSLVSAILCTVLDQACANADLTCEDTIKLYEGMYETAKKVHAVMGMPMKMEVSA